MKDNKLTIITPTYNRELNLADLHNSLMDQTNYLFNWIIIDDGSTDNTAKTIKKLINKNFEVNYFYKTNGGKHTALNYGMQFVETDLVFVVDSDDVLPKDAVQNIYDGLEELNKHELAGMVFQKKDCTLENKLTHFPNEMYIENFINFIINNPEIKETATVWVTDIVKRYPFPVFENEKYVAEGAVTNRISEKYDMLFINKVIYIYKYLNDGLTNAGRKLRISNPLGGVYLAEIILNSSKYGYKHKVKWMILYVCYSFFSGKSIIESYDECPSKGMYALLFPIGYLLFIYWSFKYN